MRVLIFFLLSLVWLPVLAEATKVALEVTVEPSSRSLRSNIEGHIGTLEIDSASDLPRVQRSSEKSARLACEALGYYNSQISSRIGHNEHGPFLHLDVIAGEAVRLRKVNIQIVGPASELQEMQFPESRFFEPGAKLNQGRYEDAKTFIRSQARRYGFFRGQFLLQNLIIDPSEGWADIDLVYSSGPRYYLGRTDFSGDQPFREELLQRMVPFKPGTPYDVDLITDLYQNLQSSEYFSSIRIDAQPSSGHGTEIPVNVVLQVREPRTLAAGLGYSTDVGPRGRFDFTRHWRNSIGHSYGLDSELSEPRQNATLWYDVPGNPPMTDKYRIAAGYQYEDLAEKDTLSRLYTIGPEWHHRLASGWQQVLSLKWRDENYRLGGESGHSELLMPGVAYTYLHSDDRLDPSKGYRIQADLSVASKALGSDADVVHGSLSIKALYTLWEKHRFLGRAMFGGTETGEFDVVPPSLRYFAGGDQSVRGYEYQSLSPRDSRGDKIGGRYIFTNSIEYQYGLTDTWRLAAFTDHGNAFNALKLPSLRSSVGVGVRWVSPIGPVRLDLAHPLDDEGGVRLHFSMGPEL